ncbi:MAG: DEAD/DEAH box helicase [Alphaproteobacteria bacterium]
MKNFNEAKLPASLIKQLQFVGFETPTPIQAETIQPALLGKDILGSAQTGTGKTGAFGIPLIAHLLESEQGSALILLPTRELASQVIKALNDFIPKKTNIPIALLIGGEQMFKQMKQLKRNPRLVVGTPGRINDHLKRKTLKLDKTDFLVLDEVDRMLDMGFGVQLDQIAKYLTGNRQTLMFSATVPKKMEKVAAKYLKDPIRVSVGETHTPAINIKQVSVKLGTKEKYGRLLSELNDRTGSVLIFVNTKRMADRLSKQLKNEGISSDALHGDLRQNKRTRTTTKFREKKFRVLVATDVAARGLDIPHIEHVVNYDIPQCPEDYIHRIGRTARAEAKGEAINFISPSDNGKWKDVQRLLDPTIKDERPKRNNRPRRDNRSKRGYSKRDNFKRDNSNRNAPKRKFNRNKK